MGRGAAGFNQACGHASRAPGRVRWLAEAGVARTHHAAAAHGATGDVQAVAHEHGAVLVPPRGHGAGRGVPLPAPVAVPRKAVRVAQRRAAHVTAATQE
jgi:hypothetical protein